MLKICSGVVTLVTVLSVAALSAQPQAPAGVPASKAPAAIVNLNAASVAQLESLPGIGAKTAALIVEYRQKNGGFKKVEELMNVKGIGEKSFLKIKALVTVAPSQGERIERDPRAADPAR